jgi:hypothetical protein
LQLKLQRLDEGLNDSELAGLLITNASAVYPDLSAEYTRSRMEKEKLDVQTIRGRLLAKEEEMRVNNERIETQLVMYSNHANASGSGAQGNRENENQRGRSYQRQSHGHYRPSYGNNRRVSMNNRRVERHESQARTQGNNAAIWENPGRWTNSGVNWNRERSTSSVRARRTVEQSKANSNCRQCGQRGHWAKECRNRSQINEEDEEKDGNDERHVQAAPVLMVRTQAATPMQSNLIEWILDCGSMVNICGDSDAFSNIMQVPGQTFHMMN